MFFSRLTSVLFLPLKLDQVSLVLPISYYLDDRYRRQLLAYRTFASDVASVLGAEKNVSVDDMNDMVDFEVRMANVCLNRAIT